MIANNPPITPATAVAALLFEWVVGGGRCSSWDAVEDCLLASSLVDALEYTPVDVVACEGVILPSPGVVVIVVAAVELDDAAFEVTDCPISFTEYPLLFLKRVVMFPEGPVTRARGPVWDGVGTVAVS